MSAPARTAADLARALQEGRWVKSSFTSSKSSVQQVENEMTPADPTDSDIISVHLL